MDELEELERLSVISKVAREINNHLGIKDKDVAEYVVHLGKNSGSIDEFHSQLLDAECDVSTSLATHLFKLIGASSSKKRKAEEKATDQRSDKGETKSKKPQSEREKRFPGLCADNNPKLDALKYDRPPEHGPLSKHAKELIDFDAPANAKEGKRGGMGDRDHRQGLRRRPLEVGGIYNGTVNRVMDYGAFISLDTSDGRHEGLVHATDIRKSEGKPLVCSELLKRNQSVKVKVLIIAGEKISLSMREVDQETGEDLKPRTQQSGTDAGEFAMPSRPKASGREGYGEITGIKTDLAANASRPTSLRAKRKLTDMEKWEALKLRQSGALRKDEYLEYDEDTQLLPDDEVEEDIEIEVQETEPVFLKGQTTRTGVQLSPIRVVANPDGSMARAAATSTALAKERREVRDAQEKSLLDSIPKDMNRPWEDPNPQPGERTIAQALRGIGQTAYEMPEWKKMGIGKSVSYGQKSNKSILEQRHGLPIFKFREQLLSAIKDNQVLVVIGETGSGKTTQMTQYLAETGYASKGMIGCTQPRRVAATSVAKRVAEEFGCRLGQEVGYSIRFEDCTSADTMIKYMTDGMLLREALVDPTLSNYAVIMLDEAHERTISTDVLFGLLKETCRQRKDFKLIVTSATLDAEKFSDYFFGAHIFTIPGRNYPVEILYTKEPEADYVEAALITVLQIHLDAPPGDILVFLTGQEEIDTACQTLHGRMQALESMHPPPLIILPVYSALPSEMQTMIFDPAEPGCRKCIVATNIAEASLTIDGIFFVVDPGFAKVKMYNPSTGMDSLVVSPISQANAKQRSGRAGRTGPGKCYRLYTEEAYKKEMLPTAVPEVQRTNLGSTVLLLKAMGINDLINFDFMDAPPVLTLVNAMEHLCHLGALEEEGGMMTRLGRKMAEFPMSPSLSKMLLTSVDMKCADEVITIVAMVSVQAVFYRPRDKQAAADQKKAKFHQPEGDHVTYLEVYKAWQNNQFSMAWCYANYIQGRALQRARDVRKQLITIMDRYKFEITSAGKDYNRIRKSICAGYFRHACRKDQQEGYRTLVDNAQVYMHPSSAVFHKNPEWVVYHELVLTTREYLRDCCTIEPNWLVDLAPALFKKASDSRLSKRKQRERVEPLFNRFEEPDAWRLSKRRG
eukprot:GHVN01042270.1.p1 GENE.GHVN01042270.1~~GHVN01042270.1.p1  ORF type:complete len:1135 (+),score=156.61 GHVN01042270.1:80-3484(+)